MIGVILSATVTAAEVNHDTLYAAIFAAASAVLVALITSRRSKRIDAATNEIRDQVKNSHSTNLREDLDDIRDLVHGIYERLDRLDTNATLERRERLAQGDRHDQRLANLEST